MLLLQESVPFFSQFFCLPRSGFIIYWFQLCLQRKSQHSNQQQQQQLNAQQYPTVGASSAGVPQGSNSGGNRRKGFLFRSSSQHELQKNAVGGGVGTTVGVPGGAQTQQGMQVSGDLV